MYLGPTKKACEISDESLLKCMKDYLEMPGRYHPEYLDILLNDYRRRVEARIGGQQVKLDINDLVKKLKREDKEA